jgi:coenzyme F420 hydrogenase subunit beta
MKESRIKTSWYLTGKFILKEMKNDADSLGKLRHVIDSGLCTRCGSCAGLSGGKVRFRDKTGEYLPEIISDIGEPLASRLWQGCSGGEVDFPGLDRFIFKGEGDHHPYLGRYNNLYVGFSKDEQIRRMAGSAGVISTILIWLLENKKIEGAVVLGMSREEPWMNHSYIATTKEEILAAAQSKYTISSVNELLEEAGNFKGRLAYVGLPCQVHSVRKLQMQHDPAVRNIHYVVAPFCGLNMHFSSVVSYIKAYGEKEYKEIRDLQFRYGEWPGSMRVEMKNGRVHLLPKFHANYLIPFHMMQRCRLCIDLANEFADISVGDAWAPVYEERGKGFSLVVVRSEAGNRIAREMAEENLLDLQPIAPEDAVRMHSHMYDNKKRGAFIRISRNKNGPVYNLPFPANIHFRRKLFESSLNLVYTILRTTLIRKIFEILPPKMTGTVFNQFKVIWKKATYSVKREKL